MNNNLLAADKEGLPWVAGEQCAGGAHRKCPALTPDRCMASPVGFRWIVLPQAPRCPTIMDIPRKYTNSKKQTLIARLQQTQRPHWIFQGTARKIARHNELVRWSGTGSVDQHNIPKALTKHAICKLS